MWFLLLLLLYRPRFTLSGSYPSPGQHSRKPSLRSSKVAVSVLEGCADDTSQMRAGETMWGSVWLPACENACSFPVPSTPSPWCFRPQFSSMPREVFWCWLDWSLLGIFCGTWYYCGTSSSEQLVLWLFVWLCNVLPAFVGGHVCFIHSWVQDPPGCLT